MQKDTDWKRKVNKKRTFNTLNIRSWKSIWCKIAQQSFNSSHNKTVKHWLKTPKVSKSIQKYPKVSKSIQKYPKVSEFANHSVPEHIGRASSRPGLASEHELSLSSQDQLEIILIILMPKFASWCLLVHNSWFYPKWGTIMMFFIKMKPNPVWWIIVDFPVRGLW